LGRGTAMAMQWRSGSGAVAVGSTMKKCSSGCVLADLSSALADSGSALADLGSTLADLGCTLVTWAAPS
jgi:hypothetical protein